MTYEKITGYSKRITDLSDTPSTNMTPAQIKQWFDSSPEEMSTAFNNLVDKLNVEDSDIKARLSSASQNLNTLNSMTAEQSQDIAELFTEMNAYEYKLAKVSSAPFDYSVPVAISPSGIPYMFIVTNDGVLGVEEKEPNKTYYQDYIVSPDGNKFQAFAENDGTIVLFRL